MRQCFFLLLIGLVYGSCIKEIIPEFGPIDPKLVINTRFSPDTTWRIHISSNAAINASLLANAPVDQAVVEIHDESTGQREILTYPNTGFYESTSFYPQTEHRYSISVTASGFPEASASSFVPKAVTASVTKTEIGVFLNNITYNADIQINDPGNEENFYFVEAYFVDQNGQDVTYTQGRLYSFDANSENVEVGTQDEPSQRLYLPDRHFNGAEYTTSVRIRGFSGGITLPTPMIQFRVQSVSKALYDYLKSYEISTSAELDISFTEPIPVITNIENGLGIFGGFSQKVIGVQF